MDELIDDLQERLNGVCGSLNLLHAQLVDLTVEALIGDLWAQYGIRSPEHWLTWKTGLSPSRARDIVLMARRKAELPHTFAAFDQGLLAVDQVIVVARHGRSCNDQELVEQAQMLTVSQLAHVLSRYRYHDSPVEPVEPSPFNRGSGRPAADNDCDGDDDDWADDDGDVTVASRFSDGDNDEPVDYAWLYGTNTPTANADSAADAASDVPASDSAADSASDADADGDGDAPTEAPTADDRVTEPVPAPDKATAKPNEVTTQAGAPAAAADDTIVAPVKVIVAGETLSYGFTADGRFRLSFTGNADTGALLTQALDEVRDALFRTSGKAATGGEVVREVCRRVLTNVAPDRADRFRAYVHLDTEGAWLNAGPRLPDWLRRKLTCDGHLTPVWETGGTPVNLGRTVRTFPDHIRRLILDRDRTCRRPGCSNTKGLEAHHIVHWEDDGESSLQNGCALCPSDHDAHHRNEFTITGNANAPGGLQFRDPRGQLIPNGPQPRPPTEPVSTAHYVHPLGEPLDSRWFTLSEPAAHIRNPTHPEFDPGLVPSG